MKKLVLLTFSFFLLLFQTSLAQNESQNDDASGDRTEKAEKKETKKSRFKKFEDLITDEAISDEGLFTVHQIDEKYYYELPFALLEKDMLWVSRISKVAPGFGGGFVSAGSKVNEQVVRWSRFNNRIMLKSVSFNSVANDSLPIYTSVVNNNHQPVIAAFKIEAFNIDSTAALIEVNDLFLSDIQAFSPMSASARKNYKIKNLDKKRSYIKRVASYPQNIEVRHDMTYAASEPPVNARAGSISMELSQSMYLLPEKPMQPRHFDQRVGWFTLSHIDYGSEELKADQKSIIRRWKLIPKDMEAYQRGELVEAEKPIVFYIDPATPDKWKPFFKQGVEDWNTCFETAGFKNAIQAKDAPSPEEDPDWSAEDARYSTVRYVASTTRNAMGPSVVDPRSGEIIESDIIWYHNHLRSYRNRYLLETGAANPAARTLDTPLEDIGEMIRRVISHEVGHALGLPHNMKASYAYPVDSLRSATFTQKWGLATTIMDYTRYNYVAQPGDEGVRWVRMLGPYDHYSINWGYRYIPEADNMKAEIPFLNSWIEEKEGDPFYMFGARNSFDPSSQTECVGDDPVLASTYGLSNLKIVSKNLADWTLEDEKGFEDLAELYGELLQVWSRYVGHVITNIGGVYEELITADQKGQSYTHLSKKEQQAAMKFLIQHAFGHPDWLLEDRVINNIGPAGSVDKIRRMHASFLRNLLRQDRLKRMVDNEAINGPAAYSLEEMFKDLRKGLWSQVKSKKTLDIYQRNLQREHVNVLINLLNNEKGKMSDISALCRTELLNIQRICKKESGKYPDGIAKYHLIDVNLQIEDTLYNKQGK
jgi:hypothetical protein